MLYGNYILVAYLIPNSLDVLLQPLVCSLHLSLLLVYFILFNYFCLCFTDERN